MHRKKSKVEHFSHDVHHDLESIIWVTAYAVMKHIHLLVLHDPNLSKSTEDEEDWYKSIRSAFGHLTLESIYNSRTAKAPLLFIGRPTLRAPVHNVVRNHVSETMCKLLYGFVHLLEFQHMLISTNMTYNDVLGLFNTAIAELEAAATPSKA